MSRPDGRFNKTMAVSFLRRAKNLLDLRILGKQIRNKRTAGKLSKLTSLECLERGSADWLAVSEALYGGFHDGVARRLVSPFDPRSQEDLMSGGMIGGDRMSLHGYARHYAKFLKSFLAQEPESLVIAECGILRGTGLAVWSSLFPGAKLIGLDIDLSHTNENLTHLKEKGAFRPSLPYLLEFDQFAPDTSELETVLGDQRIHIAVDDGFHSDETILATFAALRPLLADNFVYFAEDNKTVVRKMKSAHPDLQVRRFGQLTVVRPGA